MAIFLPQTIIKLPENMWNFQVHVSLNLMHNSQQFVINCWTTNVLFKKIYIAPPPPPSRCQIERPLALFWLNNSLKSRNDFLTNGPSD